MAGGSGSDDNDQIPQSRYKFIPEEMTWNEHDHRAMSMGGQLASIANAEENEQVTTISEGKVVWIGGMRKGRGNGPGADHWYWSDGRPWGYTNWHPGEPNNTSGRENRVHLGLQAPGTWNDVHEGWRGPAVYEMSVTGSAQTTTTAHTSTSIPSRETARRAGSIEILEAVAGKPVRFRINNRPSSNDAWVGIYPKDASDQDHGEQNKRWKWLREIDVNNASFPEQSEGDWSVRIFSDGGHTLHERKDFAVKPKHVVTDQKEVESTKINATIAFAFGLFLLIIGLPLLIGGQGQGEENLGMIIPGAILMGVGAFLAVGASFVHISSWAKSYAENGKPAPRWTWMGMVFAVLLLIPGITLLIIGSISAGTLHHEETSSARLWITDADGIGDQGFIIFIEAVPGDFDNNGIHDYCETVTVNATHSGLWMSDPWTSRAKQNDADQTRQVFELEIAHDGSGCDAKVWPEQKGSLVKLGRACYGCMAGYTDISASRNDASYPIPMWIQDGEKVVEAIGLTIAGSIMSGIGSLSLVVLGIIRKAFKAKPTPARKGPMSPPIEVLEAIEGKPVRFRINDPPGSSSAWVGIYPSSTPDDEHGEEGVRWNWLNRIDLSNAAFPEKSEGRWSIRVFSDSEFTTYRRLDFDILTKKERWWED